MQAMDLPFDPRCLEPHRARRVVATASAQQVREPLHDRWVGRAAPYAAHLAPLEEAVRLAHVGEGEHAVDGRTIGAGDQSLQQDR